MSRLRRNGLVIDDPLATVPWNLSASSSVSATGGDDDEPAVSAPPDRAHTAGPPANKTRSTRRTSLARGATPAPARPEVRSGTRSSPATWASSEPWRSWSGQTRVASYRLPDELLAELAARATQLQLPVGLLVSAAITYLLDQPDEVIHTSVDRADDARTQGRRTARRALAQHRV